MSMWIWVLLPQHHTFSIQHPCPVPWPVLLLNKVFSWNNQDHPSKFSFNSKLILLAMPVGQLEIQKWKPADVDILHFIIKLIVQTIESTKEVLWRWIWMQKVAVTVLIVQMCHTDKILSLYIMIQGLLVNVFTNNMLLPALLHMIQIAAKRLNASQES